MTRRKSKWYRARDPLPGSAMMRHNAKGMTHFRQISPKHWTMVSIRGNFHEVKMIDKTLICDCLVPGELCSHKLRVLMEIAPGMFPPRK